MGEAPISAAATEFTDMPGNRTGQPGVRRVHRARAQVAAAGGGGAPSSPSLQTHRRHPAQESLLLHALTVVTSMPAAKRSRSGSDRLFRSVQGCIARLVIAGIRNPSRCRHLRPRLALNGGTSNLTNCDWSTGGGM